MDYVDIEDEDEIEDDEICLDCGLEGWACDCFPDDIDSDELDEDDFDPDEIFQDLHGVNFLDFDEYE